MAEIFPNGIQAGLTLRRLVVQPAYPAPEWRLSVVLRGPSVIDLHAVPDGRNHLLHVPATTTREWLHGEYAVSVRAQRGDDIEEIDSGTVTVRPDIAQLAAGHDARSHVQRVLDAIEAVLEKRATLDQEQYRINNRELRRTPIADLLKLRDRYRGELARMKAASKGGLFGVSARVVFR